MKIKKKFKRYSLKITELIITEFYKKDFQNSNQEKLNIEATVIKVLIEASKEAISTAKEKFKNIDIPINITEDFVIHGPGKNYTLFNLIIEYYDKKIKFEILTYSQVYSDWLGKKMEDEGNKGIEKYFNTSDLHFNHNAYFWYIGLKEDNLFKNIEVPFKILIQYLDFRFSANNPISLIDKLDNTIKENHLTVEQQLFIYDILNGLIANADYETQEILAIVNIEILDRRWSIRPLDIQEDLDCIDTKLILEDAKKLGTIEEQIGFLKKKQLELEDEADEIGFIQGKIKEIQIYIDTLLLKHSSNNTKKMPTNNFGNIIIGDNIKHVNQSNQQEQKLLDTTNVSNSKVSPTRKLQKAAIRTAIILFTFGLIFSYLLNRGII